MVQVEKGRKLFEKFSRFLNLPKNWRFVGFVCFPEISSKSDLIEAGTAEDMKVFLLSNKEVFFRKKLL